MKNTSKNKTGTNAAATLANLNALNAQIEELKLKRIGLATPLKARYSELRAEMLETEQQIKALDETWRPEPLKAKAETRIREILETNGEPMDEAAIVKAVGDMFTKWKIKNTLKKRFTAGADGKFTVKAE